MKFLLVILSLALFAATEATFGPIAPRIPRCPDYCTELFNPVCAINERCTALFGNPCKFDDFNCNTIGRARYTVVNMSYCRFLDRYNYIKCR